MKQQVKTVLINGSIALVAGLAIFFAVFKARGFHGGGETGARVWFYDQSAKRLYAAPRDLVSPDGADEARVRAIVVGFQGMKNDLSQLRIAYLEKYSPELKALLERARTAHEAKLPFTEKIPSPSSPYAQQNTFVRRPDEATWRAMGTEESALIMAEWRNWRGPNGQVPIISVPPMR